MKTLLLIARVKHFARYKLKDQIYIYMFLFQTFFYTDFNIAWKYFRMNAWNKAIYRKILFRTNLFFEIVKCVISVHSFAFRKINI